MLGWREVGQLSFFLRAVFGLILEMQCYGRFSFVDD